MDGRNEQMLTEDERIRGIFQKYNIAAPVEEIITAQYIMAKGWYVQTTAGWFWWSGEEWKFLPNGRTQ